MAHWADEGLRSCLERLAAPSDEQRAWLRRLGPGTSPGALALDFDEEYGAISDAGGGASLSHAAFEALEALDEQLQAMSGPEGDPVFEPAALDGEYWTRVRELARRAIRAIDESG